MNNSVYKSYNKRRYVDTIYAPTHHSFADRTTN